MTSFTLPHELHGEGAHKVFAGHGWFADRSAHVGVLPDLDRTEFTCAPRAGLHELTATGLPHARLRSSGGTPIAMDETPLELIRVVEDFLRADGPHEGEQA
ncbi:hypothetical protein ACWCQZ_34150 [Streptomyces sp. NPDC002285]